MTFPTRPQAPFPIQAVYHVNTALAQRLHAVFPGSRCGFIVFTRRQERPGESIDLGDVIPPEIDQRLKGLQPAGGIAKADQTLVQAVHLVGVSNRRDEQLGPRGKVQVDRLAGYAGGLRQNIAARFWKTIDALPELAGRVRSGRQAERFYGTADLPAFYRRPYGPGWVLVGDAGLTMDPITGQGIGNAFRDAERMAEAVEAGFSGRLPLDAALADYSSQRDAETLPMYEFTAQLAALTPPTNEQRLLFAALARKPEAASRFFGVLTGSVPVQEFFAPSNLFRIIGLGGMGRLLLSKVAAGRAAV